MAEAMYKTKNRETGALIELYDAQSPTNDWDATNGRWVIVCTDHHNHDKYIKQADAYKAMTAPSGWCTGCASLKAAGKRVGDPANEEPNQPQAEPRAKVEATLSDDRTMEEVPEDAKN